MMQNFWQNVNIFNGTFYKKPLYIHFFWAILLLITLVLSASIWLNIFTRHNNYTQVPNVVGSPTASSIEQLKNADLNYVIADSMYIESYPPHTVIKQIPDANSSVKSKRTVYLIVNRSKAPFIEFPNIDGVNYTTAYEILKSKGLSINDTIYQDDLATNTVIDQMYNGKSITIGEKLPLGAAITIVLGNGKTPSYEFEWVPNLVGMTVSDANLLLQKLKLKLEVASSSDINGQEQLLIKAQTPTSTNDEGDKNKLLQGSSIMVWLENPSQN